MILGFLKELCTIEHLPDSCIIQLIKTCFTTFVVENIQLLQMKSISLISGVMKLHLLEVCLFSLNESITTVELSCVCVVELADILCIHTASCFYNG